MQLNVEHDFTLRSDNGVLKATNGLVTSIVGYTNQIIDGTGSLQVLTTSIVPEGSNLYFTTARAQAAISGSAPISVSSGVVSVTQANSTTNGYLSSTDWSTFNAKQSALNGTGFVKISGTTISYDNSTYYLASNPNNYIPLNALSASAPLSYNNTTGAFTISQSGTTSNGYLSSTDWNTFNAKQNALGYTPVPNTRQLTINGVTYDLSADRTWTISFPVTSVFGRTGAITAQSGDYTTTQVTEGTNLYFTNARAIGSTLTGYTSGSGTITSSDSILSAIQKLNGNVGLLTGAIIYQGTWNASTNTPTLTSGVGTKGYMYKVAVAGSTNIDGVTQWNVGDQLVFNGTVWDKIDGIPNEVLSVFGRVGAVTAQSGDYTTTLVTEGTNLYYTQSRFDSAFSAKTTTNLTEGTNLYFTNTRAQNAITLTTTGSSGAATYSGGTLNIPNYGSALSGYVPYTGATGNVNLGSYNLSLNALQFSSISAPSYSEGEVWYDSTQKALAYYNDVTNNILHIGQEVQLKVYNNTGSTIVKGAPVYITSTNSGFTYPLVALAKADTLTTANVIGVANQDIPTSTAGYIVLSGLVSNISTGSYTVGTVLYLSPYSAGQLMSTVPPTGYAVRVGVVSYSNSPNGSIYINQSNAYSTAASIVGTIQISQGGTGATTAGGALTNLGAQPQLNGTGFVKISGTTISYDNSTYYLASNPNNYIALTALSASSPLSYNNTTGVFSISQANNTTNGYLSSTDWATFNSKQAALNGTGFVKIIGTTISYDNSTYYLASNPNNYITLTSLSGGTGISYNGATGVISSTITQYTDAMARAAISSSAPITYNSSTGVIGITQSTSTSNGYLSSGDWITFNSKQNLVGLTTTGNSGSATFNQSTGALNIPTYTLAGLGGQPQLNGTGFVKASGTTITYDNSTYYLASNPNAYIALTALSATSPLSYNNTTGAFSITQATTSTNGYLSSTDWNTFNNKQAALTNPVTGTGTTNYLSKFTGTSTIGSSLVYDNGSAVLIGTTTAGSGKFMVYSSSSDNHIQAIGTAPSLRLADTITSPTYTMVIGLATASNNFITGSIAGDMVLSNNTTSVTGNFLFGAGATERMRINGSTGYVSIGNTNNTYNLDVTGTGRFTSDLTVQHNQNATSTSTYSNSDSTDANSRQYLNLTAGNRTLSLRAINADNTYLQSNGGNMVFQPNASTALTLASTGAATFSSSVTATNGVFSGGGEVIRMYGSNPYISWWDSANTTRYGYIQASSGLVNIVTATSTDLNFSVGGSDKMRILSNGNVGIGTSSPAAVFHVNFASSDFLLGYGGNYDNYYTSGASGSQIFRTGSTERMRITSGGFVGIGTSSPSYQFEVDGSTSNYVAMVKNITSGAGNGLYLYFPNSTSSTNTEAFLRCESGAGVKAYILTNGGLANYQSNNVNLSDKRTKKDITPLDSYWNKFKAIEIVKFKYNNQSNEEYNIGVIAQQVENVAPEFINVEGFGETPKDGIPYKTVYTTDLYHATIKVLQEAMARIEEQQAQIEELKSLINK